MGWGKVGANGNPLPVLNPNAFSDPGPWVPGDSPRILASLRLPFEYNENVALAKKFFFGERIQAELRIEFLNVLNRVLKTVRQIVISAILILVSLLSNAKTILRARGKLISE